MNVNPQKNEPEREERERSTGEGAESISTARSGGGICRRSKLNQRAVWLLDNQKPFRQTFFARRYCHKSRPHWVITEPVLRGCQVAL